MRKHLNLKMLSKAYLLLFVVTMLLFGVAIDSPHLVGSIEDEIFGLMLIVFALPFLAMAVMFLSAIAIVPIALVGAPKVSKKAQRRKAIHDFVAIAGGHDIYVKRVGTIGTYLEHFLVHYYDAENSWQVRHVVRNQMKERFYWDDPVVKYDREVSAEISQSKQQLINNLDVEIHELRHAITAARTEATQ